jgi:hypothetical protein
MTEPRPLVPEPWSSSENPARDWLYATGSIEQALAYAELFWPKFAEHEGCVLLAESVDGYGPWAEQLKSPTDIEVMLNHRHMVDLFQDSAGCEDHDRLIALGKTLKACWAAKLAFDFPGRRFEVIFDETRQPDSVDYQVTFCQQR